MEAGRITHIIGGTMHNIKLDWPLVVMPLALGILAGLWYRFVMLWSVNEAVGMAVITLGVCSLAELATDMVRE
jgi:hypothetical protein